MELQEQPDCNEPTGCPHCWSTSADAAWQFRQQLLNEQTLVDDPHFSVLLLRCPICAQAFLSIFTEMVDWLGGNDDQEWTLLPLNSKETADLLKQDNLLEEERINTLGEGRRSLRYTFPHRENNSSAWWSTGIRVGMHD